VLVGRVACSLKVVHTLERDERRLSSGTARCVVLLRSCHNAGCQRASHVLGLIRLSTRSAHEAGAEWGAIQTRVGHDVRRMPGSRRVLAQRCRQASLAVDQEVRL
jgi:hypothetical protein